jgi:hypothetical protein
MDVTGQLHGPAALSPEKEPPVPLRYEARRAPESVWMLWSKAKCIASATNRTPAAQPVAVLTDLSRLYDVHYVFPYYSRFRFLLESLYILIRGEKNKNSVVLVRTRTIPTERPQPAGKVSANFSW